MAQILIPRDCRCVDLLRHAQPLAQPLGHPSRESLDAHGAHLPDDAADRPLDRHAPRVRPQRLCGRHRLFCVRVNPARASSSRRPSSSTAALRVCESSTRRPEQLGVIGVHPRAFSRPRNPHVKLLLADGRERQRRGDDQDLIDGLALGGVRGDGVAVGKCPVLPRQLAAVLERDACPWTAFTWTRSPLTKPWRVGPQKQHVAGGDANLALLADLEGRPASGPVQSSARGRPRARTRSCRPHVLDDDDRLPGPELPAPLHEAQLKARLVMIDQAFLRIGPAEGIEHGDRLLFSREPLLLPQLLRGRLP